MVDRMLVGNTFDVQYPSELHSYSAFNHDGRWIPPLSSNVSVQNDPKAKSIGPSSWPSAAIRMSHDISRYRSHIAKELRVRDMGVHGRLTRDMRMCASFTELLYGI